MLRSGSWEHLHCFDDEPEIGAVFSGPMFRLIDDLYSVVLPVDAIGDSLFGPVSDGSFFSIFGPAGIESGHQGVQVVLVDVVLGVDKECDSGFI